MSLIALAIAVFASTNVDDLLVLVAFFADSRFRTRAIVAGQYCGIAALFGVSLAGSLLALAIPRSCIGLLGIVAIALGVQRLFSRSRPRGKEVKPGEHPDRATTTAQVATVALVTIANGADNIGVYLPLFAVQTSHAIGTFALVFSVLTGLWCLFAHWMVFHFTFGAEIRRYSGRITPFLFIVIGLLIMYEAGTFELIRGVTR